MILFIACNNHKTHSYNTHFKSRDSRRSSQWQEQLGTAAKYVYLKNWSDWKYLNLFIKTLFPIFFWLKQLKVQPLQFINCVFSKVISGAELLTQGRMEPLSHESDEATFSVFCCSTCVIYKLYSFRFLFFAHSGGICCCLLLLLICFKVQRVVWG